MANTTWNPSDVTGVVLSNANLTATASTATGGVRGIDKQNTGKFYFEYTLTTNGSTYNFGAGIALGFASESYALGGGVAGSITVDRANGVIWNGASNTGVTVGGAIATGGILCCAVDFTNGLIWFRNGAAGNWNNNVANNPATGVGGISVTYLSRGFAWYPFAGFSGVASGQNVIANFGGSAFTGAVPAGFTSGFTAGAVLPVNEVATQIAAEHWAIATPPPMQATQIGVEHWVTTNVTNPQMTATQIAIEQWASVAVISASSQVRAWIMA